jgi:apolipoprotein N-acyltransferase
MSKMGNRLRTIRDNYKMARQFDPKLGWILLAIFVIGLGAGIAMAITTGNPFTWLIISISLTLIVAAIVFSRRAMRSAYKSIEGKPGASVAVVQNMAKLGWGITPTVAVNKSQDMVHRAVGRPGVVLIGEGSSPALATMMANERKRTTRFVADIPIHEIVIGEEPGKVPIARLEKHLRKMTKSMAPGEVTSLRRKLEALANNPAPIPKGPMPKSGRMPRGKTR